MPDAKKKVKGDKESKSKISNTEWGIAIGVLLLIDIIEIGIDLLFGIGVFTNPFIDFFVNMTWVTYLYLRGVNLKSTKMVGTLVLGGSFQLIPGFDAFWAIEGLIVMLITKAEKKIKEETGVDVERITTATKTGRVVNGATTTERAASVGAEAAEAGGSEISDEYADAMGRESDERERGQSEPDSSDMGRNEDDYDGDHEISNENADELGRESDNRMGVNNKSDKENSDREKKRGKPNPFRQQGGNGELGQNKKGGSAGNSNQLDLRQPKSREEGFGGKEKSERFHSNLLDLANSYRGGEREDDFEKENEKSFPE